MLTEYRLSHGVGYEPLFGLWNVMSYHCSVALGGTYLSSCLKSEAETSKASTVFCGQSVKKRPPSDVPDQKEHRWGAWGGAEGLWSFGTHVQDLCGIHRNTTPSSLGSGCLLGHSCMGTDETDCCSSRSPARYGLGDHEPEHMWSIEPLREQRRAKLHGWQGEVSRCGRSRGAAVRRVSTGCLRSLHKAPGCRFELGLSPHGSRRVDWAHGCHGHELWLTAFSA